MSLGAMIAGPVQAWELTGHRAAYELVLDESHVGSTITALNGRMTLDWRRQCDGWSTDQQYRMVVGFAHGLESTLISSYQVFETDDGRRLDFNARDVRDSVTDAEVRGTAEISEDGSGQVRYRRPAPENQALPEGVLFPTAHLGALLEMAEADGRLLMSTIFDGSTEQQPMLVSAVIGERIPAPEGDTLNDALLARPSWPVSLAYFPLDSEQETPLFEMALRLYDDGVIDDAVIFYEGFAISMQLVSIEAVPDSC